jgi:hypothetical protein
MGDREIDVVQIGRTVPGSRISWSAAIAGALAATALTFIVVSLGSGIGLAVGSPYRATPSDATLTLIGAVWLVMAETMGFACGGYLAARLRAHFDDDVGQTQRFRDAAQGFLVWAIGVVVTALFVAIAGFYTLGKVANTSVDAATVAASARDTGSGGPASDTIAYYVDMLFRPASGATSPANEPSSAQARAEAARIVARGTTQGQLSGDDRTYLAQLVSQRTGLSADDAQRRVSTVETQARDAVKQAADKVASAGAFLSFWTFMALLFGAAAATLGGILGGEARRDEHAWIEAGTPTTIQPQ